MFIVNLAVSDLMLCLITMPLTLVEILYMTWQVGERDMIQTIIIRDKHSKTARLSLPRSIELSLSLS